MQKHLLIRLLQASPCAVYRVNGPIDGQAKSNLMSSNPAWLVPARTLGQPAVDGIPLHLGSAIYTEAPVRWEPLVDVLLLLPPRILI